MRSNGRIADARRGKLMILFTASLSLGLTVTRHIRYHILDFFAFKKLKPSQNPVFHIESGKRVFELLDSELTLRRMANPYCRSPGCASGTYGFRQSTGFSFAIIVGIVDST
jgi:hypothetical protein